MATIFVKRVGYGLVPDGEESLSEFDSIPRNVTLKAEIWQPRRLPFHKLFFKLCQRIGQGIGKSTEWVENAFKIETDHFDIFEYRGQEKLVLRSIAFHNMDQIEFEKWFNECVDIAYRRWGIDPASVADLLAKEEPHKK